MSRKNTTYAESVQLPHSWGFTNWPASVYPGDGKRAKYLFRVSQRDLLAEGACARIGRAVIFFGEGYSRFLRKKAARVPDYRIAPNAHSERPTT